jgi:hypothetical protein
MEEAQAALSTRIQPAARQRRPHARLHSPAHRKELVLTERRRAWSCVRSVLQDESQERARASRQLLVGTAICAHDLLPPAQARGAGRRRHPLAHATMSALELWVHGADLSPARCPQQVEDGEELYPHVQHPHVHALKFAPGCLAAASVHVHVHVRALCFLHRPRCPLFVTVTVTV